jgi:hypothetical protein
MRVPSHGSSSSSHKARDLVLVGLNQTIHFALGHQLLIFHVALQHKVGGDE